MKRIICDCGKRMFVFRNVLMRNIIIQYCIDCKIWKVQHNQRLGEQNEKEA